MSLLDVTLLLAFLQPPPEAVGGDPKIPADSYRRQLASLDELVNELLRHFEKPSDLIGSKLLEIFITAATSAQLMSCCR